MRFSKAPALAAIATGLGFSALILTMADAQAVPHFNKVDKLVDATSAQKVQFKVSRSKTIRSLQNKGYSDIQIRKRGLSAAHAEACKNGERYRLKVGRSGKIRQKTKIGYCETDGPRITRRELADYLETSGYRNISILNETRNHFIAQACEGRRLFSMKIDVDGAIIERDPVGTCERNVTDHLNHYTSGIPRRVIDRLHNRGFSEITFFDKRLPDYGAEACKNGKRFELTLNQNGRILNRDQIGRCDDNGPDQYAGGYQAKEALRSTGFTDIRMIDDQLPKLVAEACKDGRMYRLVLDRNGDITRGDYIGRCSNDYEEAETVYRPKDIRHDLRARGFNRIEFIKRTPPVYALKACQGTQRLRMRIDRNGKTVGRKVIGTCRDDDDTATGYAGNDITEILRSRRYYDIKLKEKNFYVAEVCRNARKFRLRIDQFGNVKKRKRIGWFRPGDDNSYKGAFMKRRWFSEEDVMARERIAPSRCQDYLEWLLQNNSITFAVGSARIEEESEPLLNRLAHVANRCPSTAIEIAGHTDSDGSDYDNQLLSERRAQSVVDYLLNRNVERRRLSAVGYGETRPIAPNDSPWDKARNRRIEFVVDWADDRYAGQPDHYGHRN